MPSPPHRAALNRLTGWSEVDLWPQLARRPEPDEPRSEVLTVYGRRSLVPARVWHELFANATASIDIVAYSCLFLAEDADVQRLLRERTQNGVRVRIALGAPEGRNVAQRGVDQGIDDIMASHVRHALLLYRSLAAEPGVDLRLHDTVLYSSIYRADDGFAREPPQLWLCCCPVPSAASASVPGRWYGCHVPRVGRADLGDRAPHSSWQSLAVTVIVRRAVAYGVDLDQQVTHA